VSHFVASHKSTTTGLSPARLIASTRTEAVLITATAGSMALLSTAAEADPTE
jgi:hypothetical protein